MTEVKAAGLLGLLQTCSCQHLDMLVALFGSKPAAARKVTRCGFATITLLSSSVLGWAPQDNSQCIPSRTFSNMPLSASDVTLAQFLCLSDNYGYLLHDPKTGSTAAVDTPDARTYDEELKRRGWTLTHILNTHYHYDHTDGNLELKGSDVTIIGPVHEKQKIPGIDMAVGGGDKFQVGDLEVQVIDVGGHTKGHVAYYFAGQSKVFVGDSLFSLGCGRMFEGTPAQFWASLERLRGLPDDTMIHCAHEYTAANAEFAMSVEPNNPDLVARVAEVTAQRARGEPTVPTLIGEEKKVNPFLRVDVSSEIRESIGVGADDSATEAFRKLRKAKDNF